MYGVERWKERDRQADRLTDRQTDRQTDWQADRLTSRHTDRQTDWQADRQTSRQTDRQTDWQADRQTGRQTDRQTDWHADRQKQNSSWKIKKCKIISRNIRCILAAWSIIILSKPLGNHTTQFISYLCQMHSYCFVSGFDVHNLKLSSLEECIL